MDPKVPGEIGVKHYVMGNLLLSWNKGAFYSLRSVPFRILIWLTQSSIFPSISGGQKTPILHPPSESGSLLSHSAAFHPWLIAHPHTQCAHLENKRPLGNGAQNRRGKRPKSPASSPKMEAKVEADDLKWLTSYLPPLWKGAARLKPRPPRPLLLQTWGR